jgi:drebrin-like protein
MARVESASGAKYTAHNERARKFEPIAPVGTNYTPVGKVDIAAIRSAAAPTAPKPAVPSASRPSVATLGPRSSSGKTVRDSAVSGAAAAARVPEGSWDAPMPTVSAAPPPPPAAPRPFPTVVGNTLSVPAHSAAASSPNVLTKPSEEDRISPVVSLSAPRTHYLIITPLKGHRIHACHPCSSQEAQ